ASLAGTAGAQRVQLELRPRAGDTLRMQLDQVTEVSAPRRGNAPLQVVTSLRMFSRAIVESTVPASSMILALTDSVSIESNDEHARTIGDQTRRQLEGRAMRMRLWHDGTVTLADAPGDVPKEVVEMISLMPASFPKEAIAVGDTWVRLMPIPPGTRFEIPLGVVVRARFRLDSLGGRGGDLAFVSMQGALETGAAPRRAGDNDPIAGTVSGSMIVNRRRGWLSESRFLVQMRATVPATGGPAAAPMRFRMKITQHMRTSDAARP
ncbi:MAG: hypothetical protein WD801_05865, partial [Gemmatimonadaceae bacterium]